MHTSLLRVVTQTLPLTKAYQVDLLLISKLETIVGLFSKTVKYCQGQGRNGVLSVQVSPEGPQKIAWLRFHVLGKHESLV